MAVIREVNKVFNERNYILKGEVTMKKETENGAEIKVEVIPKVESFWKRNKEKFVKAGYFVSGMATGVFLTVVGSKEIAGIHTHACKSEVPFEEGPAE